MKLRMQGTELRLESQSVNGGECALYFIFTCVAFLLSPV